LPTPRCHTVERATARSAAALLALLVACSERAPAADALRPDGERRADSRLEGDIDRVDAPSRDSAPAKLSVLFVGNSYTFVNDLPGTVTALAQSMGGPPLVEASSVTIGGATLAQHYQSATTLTAIAKGGHSHVVLQGQSAEPLVNPTGFVSYAGLLAAKAKSAGATVVLFETWARRTGHPDYSQSWSGGSPQAMQAKLRAAYAQAAQSSGASVAPVGDAWERSLGDQPAIELFDADGSHPAPEGTYLAACVFYASLTARSPLGSAYRPGGVSASEGAALQQVAAQVVLGP